MESCRWSPVICRISWLRHDFQVAKPLQALAGSRHVPTFGKKLLDGTFPDALLDAELIIQKMVRKGSRGLIDAVDADAIAIAVGAN
jgi:hypothetical protein